MEGSNMLVIERNNAVLGMSPENQPAAHASPGDIVCFETYDCYSNEIQREDQFASAVPWSRINPATGPLYIDGAKPGDILRVEIKDIKLNTQGVMAIAPKSGALGDVIEAEKTKILPIADGKAKFNDLIDLELSPMIGVIGTAPETGEIPTGTPGEHGGNMDCKRIGKGSVVYLPVNVPGALLAMGDLHAVMGDGEVVICGVEISGEVTVKVDVVRGLSLPLPMVTQGGDVMAIASAPTLDEAARAATKNMFDFLNRVVGLTFDEAGMLLSTAGDLRICQIVDPLMTARMEFPLWILDKYGYSMP
jgi:amidase